MKSIRAKSVSNSSNGSSENSKKKTITKGSVPAANKRQGSVQQGLTQSGIRSYSDPTPLVASLSEQQKNLEKEIEQTRSARKKKTLEDELKAFQASLKRALVREAFKNQQATDDGTPNKPVELEDPKTPEVEQLGEEEDVIAEVVEGDTNLSNGVEPNEEGEIMEAEKPNAKEANVSPPKVVNPYESKGNGGMTSIKDALMNEHHAKAECKYFHRYRVSHDCKQVDPNGYSEEVKSMTIAFDNVIRAVDKTARLTTWLETEMVLECPKKISPSLAIKYIDVPSYIRGTLGCKRQFRLGFRVCTNLTLHEFTNTWSKFKSVNGWSHIVPAEMQHSPTAYAVGLCQGSSYGKDCVTLNKELSKDLECQVEASWQNITGLEKFKSRMWTEANKVATKEGGDHMPTYNRVKQAHSPSGLIIHVTRKEDMAVIMKKLAKEYGKSKDSKWPVWPDEIRPLCPPIVKSKNP